MSRSSKRRFFVPPSKQLKQYGFGVVALLIVALLVFAELILPNHDAKAYTSNLQSASTPLDNCLQKLDDTTQQDIFYAPDIDLSLKQSNVKVIRNQVAACRSQLDAFSHTSQGLLSLHLSGYTKTYRDAQLAKRHATSMVSQCDDVLGQYDNMAAFLEQYYGHIITFMTALSNLNKAEDNYTLSNANKQLSKQGNSLHAEATAMRSLKAPTGFTASRNGAADMIDQMANGFDNLARGYDSYSDYYKSLGYRQIDGATATYDNTVIGQPYALLHNAYILKEINSLPSKVENLLAVESE